MPSPQIYVLEMIIYRIELEPSYSYSIKDKGAICLNFKFAHRLNFDINTEFSAQELEDNFDGKMVDMNNGKTYLFVMKPSELRQFLVTEPYQLTLLEGNYNIGTASIPWKKEFSEMVRFFETLGIVKSTTYEDWYELKNDKGHKTAKLNIFLRMSCCGTNVQTTFQIKKVGPTEEYFFRQANMSKTFKVEKVTDERYQPLVASLYAGPITDTRSRPESLMNLRENASLTQLFDREILPKTSELQGPDDIGGGINLDFNQDYDIVSMCFRPSENKFFDLLDIITANVTTYEKGTCIEFKKSRKIRDDVLKRSERTGLNDSEDEENENDVAKMTGDHISSKLCGNKDCPAVKKFKEYGIGPLATGKNLGTLYSIVEPQVTYGMSHTYGILSNYGPYGVFSRPKQEELPFIPLDCEKIKVGHSKANSCYKDSKEKKKKAQWHSQNCPLCPKRLRGGADGNTEFFMGDQQIKEQEGLLKPPSPMEQCKSIMDQFDTILLEYKKAIGPCGQATCPYAQTLAEDACKKDCGQPMSATMENPCNDVPCENQDCPYVGAYTEEPKKNRFPSGCENPKCAYTKYKLGLLDVDAELELQFLPPALAGNCGSPNCRYPVTASLPPIHWDCPDPLPKGHCKNINCPYQPVPLNKTKTKKQYKTAPCGSPTCLYALPEPCNLPTCPFAMRPCPMGENIGSSNLCENPHCPFAKSNVEKDIPNQVNDPKFKGDFQDCINPDCPYKGKSKKKKSRNRHKANLCSNPLCPSNKPKKERKNKRNKISDDDISVQDNMQTGENNSCDNPNCPFNKQTKKKQSSATETESICSDPECPYAELKKNKKSDKANANQTINENLCSNPKCPQRLSSKEAETRAICVDPTCPYAQPLISCGIPNCPYEPVSMHIMVDQSKSAPGNTDNNKEESNRGRTAVNNMPTAQQNTTVCEENTKCEPLDVCENPDCEMKETDETAQKTEQNKTIALATKKGKRKNKGKFVYSIGDKYPGLKLGHKECVTPVFNVPPHMGWLWNIFTPVMRLKPRPGWRPGALTKTIAARIRAHRQAKGLGQLKLPNFKIDGTKCDDDGGPKVVPKPTLQIQKKGGVYWITMNPLKDPLSLAENEDPYMECTPMTFKITKNKKQDDDYCYCDEEELPENLSSSSDSELDIEFTPPAGIIHPERFKKKPNIVCCESQYDPKDFEAPKKEKKEKEKDKGGKGGKAGKKEKKGKKKK